MITSILFDTETTGLVESMAMPIDKQPEIIQIHMEKLVDGELVDTLSSFVKPFKSIPELITEITSITDDMVKDAPRWSALAKSVQEFVADADEIVAHNLSFDMDMINIETKRLGEKFWWPRYRLCTVEATEHIAGRRMNLQALHQHLFGEGFTEAHLAQNDVAALRRCFVELRKTGEI